MSIGKVAWGVLIVYFVFGMVASIVGLLAVIAWVAWDRIGHQARVDLCVAQLTLREMADEAKWKKTFGSRTPLTPFQEEVLVRSEGWRYGDPSEADARWMMASVPNWKEYKRDYDAEHAESVSPSV